MRTGTPGAHFVCGGVLEGGQPPLVTAHHLTVDQARPHLEMVHGLDQQWIAVRPVIAPPGDQPDAHGIAPGKVHWCDLVDFWLPA